MYDPGDRSQTMPCCDEWPASGLPALGFGRLGNDVVIGNTGFSARAARGCGVRLSENGWDVRGEHGRAGGYSLLPG